MLFCLFLCVSTYAQDFNFERSWGTYFGDNRFYLQDSKTDSLGNVYIAGFFAASQNTVNPVFSTPNSFQSTYAGGETDGFIAKFNSSGQLVWATYFGGEAADAIQGIDIDGSNNIYILGTTSSINGIATDNAFQEVMNGTFDFFIARFSATGVLSWSTYYGGDGSEGDRGLEYPHSESKRNFICHDQSGNLYIAGKSNSTDLGTEGTFQPSKETSSQLISKFTNEGIRLWCTYYSINLNYITGISANSNALYVRGRIADCFPNSPQNSYYGSANGYQTTPLHCNNTFLSKFDVSGGRIWSTYYAQNNITYSNSVKAYNDKVYFVGHSRSNLVATPGAFQESAGSEPSPYLVQFSEDGSRNWGTFNGDYVGPARTSGTNSGNVNIDKDGAAYLGGDTNLNTNIATTGAYQSQLSGEYDGYVCKYNSQGQKIWGTYYGGNLMEYDVNALPYNNGFYVVGRTTSTSGIATSNSYQESLVLTNVLDQMSNIFIAHFEPIPLGISEFAPRSFTIFPNPNQGSFTVRLSSIEPLNHTLELYDIVGKKVLVRKLSNLETVITTQGLSKGIYVSKVLEEYSGTFLIKKIIIE